MNSMSKKILLVEDEALIAMAEAQMIRKHGYEVLTVHSGEKAVEAAETDPDIALILMDIDLGRGIDGPEAAEKILASQELPIVFLSSHSEKEYVDRVKTITGSGYILKNSGEFVLIESIHMALNLFEAKREAQHHLRETELRELRLDHLNRLLLSIRNVNQLITKETDTRELLDKTCSLLIETSGYQQAWIVLLEDGKPKDPYFHAGFSGTFAPMTDFLNGGTIPDCAAAVLKEGKIQTQVQDSAACGNCPFRNLEGTGGCAGEEGTLLTAKLEHAGKLQGWISVLVPKLYADNRDDQRLYEEIAGDISYALENIAATREIIETKSVLENTMNAIPDTIGVLDSNFKVICYNQAGYQLLGKTQEEVEGKTCYELIDKVLPCTNCTVQESYTTKRIEQYERYEPALDKWFDLRAYPILDEQGNVTKIIEHFRDITERKRAEKALKERLEELQSIQWMLSNKTTRQEESIPGYGDLSELNKEGLILHSVGKEQLKEIASEYLDLLETSTAVYEKEGSYALGLFTSGWCRLMDSASRKLCQTGDNREALKSGKWLCHESCWNVSSLAMGEKRAVDARCSGGINLYALPVLVNGEAVGAINFGYGSPPTDEAALKTLSQRYAIPVDELKKQAEAYKPRPQFIIDYAKERIQIAATHLGRIIKLKRNEDTLDKKGISRFDELVANIPVGVYIVWIRADRSMQFEYVSDQWCAIHKLQREEVIADAATVNNQVPLEEREDFHRRNMEAARTGKPFLWEGRFIVSDGDPRWLRIESVPTLFENRDIRWFGVTQDITDRKEAEEELREALQEKEFLMKELNHRVKNNLIMISSLISLKDSETAVDLSDIQHQIEAISLIHEKLHQTGNITKISCRDYVDDLLRSIFSSFSKQPVRIESNIADIQLPTKAALSLGLIINEIATNAIKHGFSPREEALFSISMEIDKEHGRYLLSLSNSGKPFPEDIDLENPDSLGLRLISALITQIDGTLELQKTPYPVFTIRFPIKEVSRFAGSG
jgi:PAS domain S-box-containing protein